MFYHLTKVLEGAAAMLLGAAGAFLYVDFIGKGGGYEIQFWLCLISSTALRIFIRPSYNQPADQSSRP